MRILHSMLFAAGLWLGMGSLAHAEMLSFDPDRLSVDTSCTFGRFSISHKDNTDNPFLADTIYTYSGNSCDSTLRSFRKKLLSAQDSHQKISIDLDDSDQLNVAPADPSAPSTSIKTGEPTTCEFLRDQNFKAQEVAMPSCNKSPMLIAPVSCKATLGGFTTIAICEKKDSKMDATKCYQESIGLQPSSINKQNASLDDNGQNGSAQ